jgi:hypothetical protein
MLVPFTIRSHEVVNSSRRSRTPPLQLALAEKIRNKQYIGFISKICNPSTKHQVSTY